MVDGSAPKGSTLTRALAYVWGGAFLAFIAAFVWIEAKAPSAPNLASGQTALAHDHGHGFYVLPYQVHLFDGSGFFGLWLVGFVIGLVGWIEKGPERTARSYATGGVLILLLAIVIIAGFVL